MGNEDDPLNQELKRLMAAACRASIGSRKRNQCLTRVVQLVEKSNRLWRDPSPCYPDALQNTWLHVFQKPETYNPERGEVIAWIKVYLKYRLMDEKIRWNKIHAEQLDDSSAYHNPLENIPDRPQIPPILEETFEWINADPQKILCKTHLRGRPDVNAQLLLSERMPPKTNWEELSEKLNVSISTLSAFYKRKCLPLLRDFGSDRGYL